MICNWCDEAILPTETRSRGRHVECALRAIVGSVGHLNKTCSCYGGKEEDPPGLTRRQAAKAALEGCAGPIILRQTRYLEVTPVLTVWVVYERPSDYPNDYVLRGQDVLRDGAVVPHTEPTAVGTLELVRAAVPEGCVCLARDIADEPHIVETWL